MFAGLEVSPRQKTVAGDELFSCARYFLYGTKTTPLEKPADSYGIKRES